MCDFDGLVMCDGCMYVCDLSIEFKEQVERERERDYCHAMSDSH